MNPKSYWHDGSEKVPHLDTTKYTLYAEVNGKNCTIMHRKLAIEVLASSKSEAVVMAVEYIKDETPYEVSKIWIGSYVYRAGVISCNVISE